MEMDKRMERRVHRQRMAGFVIAATIASLTLLKLLGLL